MQLSRRRLIGFAAAGIICSVLAGPSCGADAQARKLLEYRESVYNNIYVYQQGTNIILTFGQNRKLYYESLYNTLDPTDLPARYTQMMTAALAYPEKPLAILEIGLGGGRTASYLHHYLPEAQITSVELDPVVFELAKKYFNVKAGGTFKVVAKDGRLFLADSKAKYDIILIDAYRAPFVPFHLLTREFYEIVRDHLTDGGVVAQNVEPSTMLFDAAVKTIHAVFPQTEFYVADGNVVTAAYLGKLRTGEALARRAAELQAKYHLRYRLSDLLAKRRLLPPDMGPIDPSAKVLTDDFAPVDALKAIERHNRKWPGTADATAADPGP
ncbi:MAG TPA: fused MFS/spermidine synthase [Stellaceae bacterium]|nr:fused MFS/spermidine synthase [Stellaceae bacterium]